MKTAVDLFAGVGGFTLAAERAGHRVLWAANHNQKAVDWHALNHPATIHRCQDLQQADFTQVPDHDTLLASPACQGHSLGRGVDLPRHDAQRATAWAVVTCLEVHRPASFIIENVERFRLWKLYPAWRQAVAALGYTCQELLLDAADFGVPQNRVRLFIVGTRGKAPNIQLPPKVPPVPASSFLRMEEGIWRPVELKGRSLATVRRWRAGRKEFGDTFLMPYYSRGSGLTGRSIHRPIGTLTTKARWAIVREGQMRMLSVPEQVDAMGFPVDYKLPASSTLATFFLGNAVCPAVAEAVIRAL